MPPIQARPDVRLAALETLSATPADPRDAALRALIRRYAEEIEATNTTEKLGSRLLSALEALQATPRARARASEGDSTSDAIAEFFSGTSGS